MIKLKEMNPQLYENFVNLVPSKELMLIDRDLEKALSIMQSATNAWFIISIFNYQFTRNWDLFLFIPIKSCNSEII